MSAFVEGDYYHISRGESPVPALRGGVFNRYSCPRWTPLIKTKSRSFKAALWPHPIVLVIRLREGKI